MPIYIHFATATTGTYRPPSNRRRKSTERRRYFGELDFAQVTMQGLPKGYTGERAKSINLEQEAPDMLTPGA